MANGTPDLKGVSYHEHAIYNVIIGFFRGFFVVVFLHFHGNKTASQLY